MSVNNDAISLSQIYSEYKSELPTVALVVTLVAAGSFALYGIVHFIPQWTSPYQGVLYMLPNQFAQNAFAFSALTIGLATSLATVAKLIKDKISDYFGTKEIADLESSKWSESHKYLVVAAVAIVAAIAFFVIASNALNHLYDINLPHIVAISQQQLNLVWALGVSGAVATSIGLYATAHYVNYLIAKVRENANPQDPDTLPYPDHDNI